MTTCLSKLELDAAKNFSTSDDLTADVTYAGDMKAVIKEFVDNSNDLVGEAWDKEKKKFNYYSEKLTKQMAIAGQLKDAINSALNKLLSAMSPDELINIDQKSIDETGREIESCQIKINELDRELNSYVKVYVDANGKISSAFTAGATLKTLSLKSANPQRYNTIFADLTSQKEMLLELKRMYQKMIDLKSLSEQVKKELDQVFSDIQKYWADDAALSLV